ncbi:hypothetical protein IQ07DRAFT_161190 [Pyrenochaeta sp. DS3sAY3a]|nr:hypothetical protein IQ07DRAFT_161190 [Pyrenochaeta sp. DS3sAY3a]
MAISWLLRAWPGSLHPRRDSKHTRTLPLKSHCSDFRFDRKSPDRVSRWTTESGQPSCLAQLFLGMCSRAQTECNRIAKASIKDWERREARGRDQRVKLSLNRCCAWIAYLRSPVFGSPPPCPYHPSRRHCITSPPYSRLTNTPAAIGRVLLSAFAGVEMACATWMRRWLWLQLDERSSSWDESTATIDVRYIRHDFFSAIWDHLNIPSVAHKNDTMTRGKHEVQW